MPSKSQMIKNLRQTPGVSIFSPELQAKIEKCHSENDNCFLCKELSTENSILEKITKSSWTKIVPFMKKTGIPPCMIDIGRTLEDKVLETGFSYTIFRTMEIHELVRCDECDNCNLNHNIEQKYRFIDVEKCVLEILIDLEEFWHINRQEGFVPDFTSFDENRKNCAEWPVELDGKIYFQAVVINEFLKFEEAIAVRIQQIADLKSVKKNVPISEKTVAPLQSIDDILRTIMQNEKSLFRPKKLAEKKRKKKSEVRKSDKPRIVRTKIHGASKPKKSDVEDTKSIDRNKFQRRFKKTKRNDRV